MINLHATITQIRSYRPLPLIIAAALLCGARASADVAGLIADPGFEHASGGASAWKPYGQGYEIVSDIRRTGEHSIRCANAKPGEPRGAAIDLPLNQRIASPVLVTGWSRAENVSGSQDNDYSLYADLDTIDGKPIWGQVASFDVGTHDWQRRKLLVISPRPIRTLHLFVLFRNHTGTAWFDDIQARPLSGRETFDGQPIAPPALPARAASGWFVRDVGSDSPIVEFKPASAGRERSAVALGVGISNASGAGPRVISNLRPGGRALTIYYVERFWVKETVWWNDIRSYDLAGAADRSCLTSVNVGATGGLSLYPLACVSSGGVGRAVAVPMGPRVVRLGFHGPSHLLYAAIDVWAPGRGERRNALSIDVRAYDIDGKWGFRSATAGYYKLFPDAFRRRAVKEGIWIPFTSPGSVSNPEDFHFGFHEGDDTVAADNRLGVLPFRYSEPMTYWMAMKPAVPRDYSHAIAILKGDLAGSDIEKRKWAQAVFNSGEFDRDGKLDLIFVNAFGTDGGVWTLNPTPGISAPPGEWTKARLNFDLDEAAKRYGPAAPGTLAGEYLDSLEGWAERLDYRPSNLAASSLDLTFGVSDLKPTLPTWFAVWDYTRWLSADLHRRGKLLMANSTPWKFNAFAGLLDVLGTETNWMTNGEWKPDSDAIMNLRRTLCYHKPYLLLMNTDFTRFSHADVERYFRRCLFYGIFPSMFSVDGASKPYWQDAALYNRDRDLFKRYVPLIAKVSSAGWEPITQIRSDNRDVWVERFGSYVTVFNAGSKPATARLKFERASGGRTLFNGMRQAEVVSVIDGRTIARVAVAAPALPVTVQPGETLLLDIGRAR
jgi:hypothetical protein